MRCGSRDWKCMAERKWHRAKASFRSTGNTAFDEYREQTLRRLEEEADEFQAFLDRLREARDKSEFDQFMAERDGDSKRNGQPDNNAESVPQAG